MKRSGRRTDSSEPDEAGRASGFNHAGTPRLLRVVPALSTGDLQPGALPPTVRLPASDDERGRARANRLAPAPWPRRVLTTRLRPPPAAPGAVPRVRLMQLLDTAPAVRLTAVTAAGGFGKTTLLGGWCERQARMPVAWLTLDEADDDPTVLWADLLAALRQALPDLEIAASACAIPDSDVPAIVPVELVNELSERGDAALVLDDLHRLSSGRALDSIAWLAQNGPPGFHLIVAGRTEPRLPLSAMRARGALTEIRAERLGLTVDEADAYLNGHHRLDLEPSEVALLVEQTEGWPAGIHLAALSMQGAGGGHRAVRGFTGRNRFVRDFLADEVLGACDPPTQDLLLRSSVLGRFSGPLCDAALLLEGSQAALERLAAANLFVVPLDDEEGWYRFHRLAGEYLLAELERRRPGAAATIHSRAYDWHLERGSLDEAMHHALHAGRFAEAAQLMASRWPLYAADGRHALMLEMFDRLPAAAIRGDQRLLLAHSWTLTAAGRPAEAREAADAVEEMGGLQTGPLDDGFASVESSLATVRALMHDGHSAAAVESGRRAVELTPAGSPWRATACYGLGTGLFLSGALDEADRWLIEAVELALAHRRWLLASTSLGIASLLVGDQLRFDDQAVLAEQSHAMAEEHALDRVAFAPQLALGACLGAGERAEEALVPLARCIELVRDGRSSMHALALIHFASALHASGRRRAAADALGEAAAVIGSQEDPGALPERLELLTRGWANGRRADAALTERERTILRMLKGTLSERDIGRELYLSRNTIHSHTMSIYRKLGVSSRAEAVRQAQRARLL
jgi:LuxR family transcriptional regulator, maltose regulon positive regulatory protein